MQNRLDNKQQAIIPIAAFAAKGDTEKLAAEIQHGLDTGLTINEIKEVLIQLYGRCEQVPDMRSCLSSGAMEQGSS